MPRRRTLAPRAAWALGAWVALLAASAHAQDADQRPPPSPSPAEPAAPTAPGAPPLPPPPTEPAPQPTPTSPAPTTGYHVPPGYQNTSPPTQATPAVVPVDPERARKQALRDQMRLTVGVGVAYTGLFLDLNADGYEDLNEGWAVAASIGGRYHFARFGSFQARALLLGGRYVGDREFGILAEGGQIGVLAQATVRFVGYPFYLGAGATLGFFTQLDLETQLSAGVVGEIGVVFGHDEQIDLGMQLVLTSGVYAAVGMAAWSFGDP